ncbi:MAG: diguanylate cyclase [Burkholderiaceae bacterium]
MTSPDVPSNEASRLAALRALNILDTGPDERFDRLTRITRRVFDVPIALVSLVDENRQWFKSCIGLPVRQTPRDVSFCGHAILTGEILVVPDATTDERFADNPLVTGEPGIRFYAGYPLDAGGGTRLGTLCVIDTKPRRFAPEDEQLLRDLGVTVQRELMALSMATTDELTGLSNRRGLFAIGEKMIDVCRRGSHPVAAMFFDLDGFKAINDRFGHAEGDGVLVSFADLLRKTFRNSDVIARLGGDEFVVVLPGASLDEARAASERLRAELDARNRERTCGYAVACSIGLAEFDHRTLSSLERMLAVVDRRMYDDKQRRKLG